MSKFYVILALLGLILLTGCDPQDLSPGQTSAVCKALIGPIRYNTYDPNSQRYAAILLAMDLKQRNQVGYWLHCPQYKHVVKGTYHGRRR